MLANAGVNINDSVQVRNYLNSYYNRNYSYAAYSQVLSGCANQTLNYVLALPGIEAEEAKGAYRYGFNAGSEKDDEIFIGAYTAEYWEYDSRLGRRWNVDPLTYAWQSSYAAFNNNPIYFVDPLGLEGEPKEFKGKVATFFHRIWDGIRGDGWNKYYTKHSRKNGGDGGGSWLKKIIQPISNTIRNIFTGGKYNRNTVPVAKYMKTDWIELEPVNESDGVYRYDVPANLAGNKLIGTRLTLDFVPPSLGIITLAGEIGNLYLPMRIFPYNTDETVTGYHTYSGIWFFLGMLSNPLSLYAQDKGDAKLNNVAMAMSFLKLVPGRTNPVFRRTNHFRVREITSKPINHSFYIKQKVLTPIMGRGRLSKWYHGL